MGKKREAISILHHMKTEFQMDQGHKCESQNFKTLGKQNTLCNLRVGKDLIK